MTEIRESSPRVLLVDDDPTVRFLVREGLEPFGFDVEEAEDGEQALARFQAFKPEMVLLDIVMPGMDGFETCAALRKLPGGSSVPILVLTGLEDTDSINRAFEVGATTFVAKPINSLVLMYRLRYIMRAKTIHDQLLASETRLRHAQRIAKLGHWEWRPGSKVVRVSEGFCEILGLPTTTTTISVRQLMGYVHNSDRSETLTALRRALGEMRGYRLEHAIRRTDGETRYIYQETELVLDSSGAVDALVGIAQDITQRRHDQERIRHLAYFDTVTDLPNRTLLTQLIDQAIELANRHDRQSAVLLIDLDNFKMVNDQFGHDAGDQLLRQVAQRIKQSLRRSDRLGRSNAAALATQADFQGDAVSRLGGDEFVVLLSEIGASENSARVARRLADALGAPFTVGGNEVSITASIGISIYPLDGATPEMLLKHADVAMYHAKKAGRDGYQFFTDTLNREARRRFLIESNLRRAADRGEFRLHYQPKIDIRRNRVAGFEALLRWHHPDLGLVPPGEFIPVAEEAGLIIAIGDWVLDEACRQAAVWREAGITDVPVAVNLSAAQFKREHIVGRVAQACRSHGVDPASLELELTESLLIDDVKTSITIMEDLVALGVSLSIDDFGTGYSSLSYLKRFPLNALKIDRTFVRDLHENVDDAIIVEAMIALAHNLRLKVVAEGVETIEQLHYLKERNCDEVQGYLFCKPRPADEIADWLRDEPLPLALGQPRLAVVGHGV